MIYFNSKKVRAAGYDPDKRVLVLDFGQGDAAPKLYRYLDVPPDIFAEIERRHNAGESVGEYIDQAVTGSFKDAEIPFAWQRLDDEGFTIEESKKPIRMVRP